MFEFLRYNYCFIHIKANNISCFNSKDEKVYTLDIPSSIAAHGEIFDNQKYRQKIWEFLQNKIMKNDKCFIALHNELTFQQSISLNAANKPIDKQEEGFFDKVPITKNQMRALKRKNSNVVFAYNQEITKPIEEFLKNLEAKIITIFPLSLFKKIYINTLSVEDIHEIMKAKKRILFYNFYRYGKGLSPELSKKGKTIAFSQFFFLLFALVLFFAALLYALTAFSIIKIKIF